MAKIIAIILATLITTAHAADIPPLDQTVPLDQIIVLNAADSSMLGRTRGNFDIYADTTTHKQRAHTALNFAIAVAVAYNLQSARVTLHPDPGLLDAGHPIAIADYSPDGGGPDGRTPLKHTTWQVRAYTGDIEPQSLQIAKLWHQLRNQYQIADKLGSYTDEPALKAAIANQLNIPAKQVRLPLYVARMKHL